MQPTNEKSSTQTANTYDVVIAGAGPVGLSLALALGRRGKRVLLLEKNETFSEHSRAPAVWPRTQEILDELGVMDSFLKQGIKVSQFRAWDADNNRAFLSLSFGELQSETKFPYLIIIPQNRTEHILYEALQAVPSVTVRFESEVRRFSQETSRVTVVIAERGKEKIVHAKFLAGCEGAHSAIRKALGFSFEGMTYPLQVALADIRLKEDRDFEFPRFSNKGVVVIALRIEANLWRLILPYKPDDGVLLEERIRQSARQLFQADNYELIWKSEFHLHRRVSEGFVNRRVVLAGDAAHLNSPVGGQGMNAGIQDAAFLGGKLIEAIDRNELAPVVAYGEERKRAIRRGVNAFTNALTRVVLFQNGKSVRIVFRVASFFFRFRPLRIRFLRRMTMLDTKKFQQTKGGLDGNAVGREKNAACLKP